MWNITRHPSLTLVAQSLFSPRPGRSSCQLFAHRVAGEEDVKGVGSTQVELLLQLLHAHVSPAQIENTQINKTRH